MSIRNVTPTGAHDVEPTSHLDGLGVLLAMKAGSIPLPEIASTLGFELREVEAGHVVFAMRPARGHYNPMGVVHGGVTAALLDTAMGCAAQTRVAAHGISTTLDISIRYLRPITIETGEVLATGNLVHFGRRTAVSQAHLVDLRRGALLATGTSTLLMTLSG